VADYRAVRRMSLHASINSRLLAIAAPPTSLALVAARAEENIVGPPADLQARLGARRGGVTI
jgi:hypothetical protein